MRSIRRSLNLPTVLLVLGAFALVAYSAVAYRQAGGTPTSVATVNLVRVLEGLDQRAMAEADFVAMAETILAEDEAKQGTLEAMRTSLQELPESDVEGRRALRDRLELGLLEFQGWRQFKSEQVDIEKSLLLRDIYQSIRRAISELCEAEGYDLVIVDDSSEQLLINPQVQATREAQIKQQLSSRRLIYVNPSVDITNDVVARMNNAFNAGP
jgi:Skp family chaperone for outer membrane proteins